MVNGINEKNLNKKILHYCKKKGIISVEYINRKILFLS